jgi:hypothetical protein
LAAGVLGSRGEKKRPRRRLKHLRGSHQSLGITLEDPAGIPGHPREQRDRRPLPPEQVSGLQDTYAQAGITGGRRHPRTQDHPI